MQPRSRLPQPGTSAGRDGLAALLADPAGALLACDYDGTLAAIVDDPTAARPQPGAIEALARIAGLVGSVAVVTGRPVDQVVELGGLRRVDDVVVLGSYGAERWAAGSVTRAPGPRLSEGIRGAVDDVVRRHAPEARVEVKGTAGCAVHVRGLADPEAALEALTGPLRELASASGLVLEPGRHVLELRPTGSDKGGALTALADERASTSVAYIGDDLGDLPAFRAVRTMRRAGRPGLSVASASTEAPEVAAEADLVLAGPEEVVTFLRALAEEISRGQESLGPGRGR